jgi:N-acetylglucosaminyldiphosphoundecaprenol N-acetyl-beta-D-mannosaminyltransferase
MDFAVLSSNKSEGSSNALVEIMSFGKAVVATDVVGNRELITCGVNGYIVKPQRPEEISEKIIYLLENDEKRKILGQNARQHTYDHFSYEQMIKAYEHVYTDLMHGYFQNISNSKTCGRDRFIRKKVQPLDRIKILDIPIDCLSLDQCVEKLIAVIPERRSFYIIVVNAAKLVKAQRDPELAHIIRSADLVGTDGVPIVWVSKFFKKSLPGRVNGTDLMYKLLETAAIKGYRIYLLGARQSVIESAVENLKDKYPALEICGYRNGYFESESEAETVVAEIAHLDVDILLIGMGSPMKEKWVHKYRQRLKVSIIHGVGGSFDILGGITKRAPEWMQKCGLEWLFRLYQEPKRLWKRYLILNVVFIWLVFKEGFYRFSGKSN